VVGGKGWASGGVTVGRHFGGCRTRGGGLVQRLRWAGGFLRGGTLVRSWVRLPNSHAIYPSSRPERCKKSYAEPRVGVTLANAPTDGESDDGGGKYGVHHASASWLGSHPDIRMHTSEITLPSVRFNRRSQRTGGVVWYATVGRAGPCDRSSLRENAM